MRFGVLVIMILIVIVETLKKTSEKRPKLRLSARFDFPEVSRKHSRATHIEVLTKP